MLSLSAAWKRAGDDHQCLADAGESSTVLPIAYINKNNKKDVGNRKLDNTINDSDK